MWLSRTWILCHLGTNSCSWQVALRMYIVKPRNFCGTSLPSGFSCTPRKGSFPLFSFVAFSPDNLCILKLCCGSLWPPILPLSGQNICPSLQLLLHRAAFLGSLSESVLPQPLPSCPSPARALWEGSRENVIAKAREDGAWEGSVNPDPVSHSRDLFSSGQSLLVPCLGAAGLFLGKSVQGTKQLVARVRGVLCVWIRRIVWICVTAAFYLTSSASFCPWWNYVLSST